MTIPQKPTYNSLPDNDEIDLKQLFITLWQGKGIILACTFIFSTISVVYALTAQQWWTAKAIITTPQVTDVVDFIQTVKRYQPAFDVYQSLYNANQSDKNVISGNELDKLIDQKEMFDRFVQAFNTNDNKKLFLAQSVAFSKAKIVLGQNTTENERAERQQMRNWFDRIVAKSEIKLSPEIVTLSVQSIDDNNSFALLTDYILFTNKQVTRELMDDLASTLKIKRNELEQQLETRQKFVRQKLQLEIVKAENSLKIAKAANINRPLENVNKEELFSIDLGSDAIAEKIIVLKSMGKLSLLDPSIDQISNNLTILDRVLPNIEQLDVISVLESPEKPINRDEPKRSLIVLLATLLGGMLGTAIVLVRKAFI